MSNNELIKEKNTLLKYLSEVNDALSSLSASKYVDANLHTYIRGNHSYFYEYCPATGKKTYLPFDEEIKNKYQYEYLLLAQKTILRQISVIDTFIKTYSPSSLSEVYTNLPKARKPLVNPLVPTNDSFISEWLAKKSEQKLIHPNNYSMSDAFLTDNGDYVRSKSEKFIADKLKSHGIIYVYECPLKTIDNSYVFPDFTILDIRTRTEKYLEHCGRMDDPQYTERFVQKHEIYEKSGLVAGKNLFYTYETAEHPLKTCSIDAIINQIITY